MASLLLDDQEQVTLVKVKSYIGRKRGREGDKVRYKESEVYIERDKNKEREREIQLNPAIPDPKVTEIRQ